MKIKKINKFYLGIMSICCVAIIALSSSLFQITNAKNSSYIVCAHNSKPKKVDQKENSTQEGLVNDFEGFKFSFLPFCNLNQLVTGSLPIGIISGSEDIMENNFITPSIKSIEYKSKDSNQNFFFKNSSISYWKKNKFDKNNQIIKDDSKRNDGEKNVQVKQVISLTNNELLDLKQYQIKFGDVFDTKVVLQTYDNLSQQNKEKEIHFVSTETPNITKMDMYLYGNKKNYDLKIIPGQKAIIKNFLYWDVESDINIYPFASTENPQSILTHALMEEMKKYNSDQEISSFSFIPSKDQKSTYDLVYTGSENLENEKRIDLSIHALYDILDSDGNKVQQQIKQVDSVQIHLFKSEDQKEKILFPSGTITIKPNQEISNVGKVYINTPYYSDMEKDLYGKLYSSYIVNEKNTKSENELYHEEMQLSGVDLVFNKASQWDKDKYSEYEWTVFDISLKSQNYISEPVVTDSSNYCNYRLFVDFNNFLKDESLIETNGIIYTEDLLKIKVENNYSGTFTTQSSKAEIFKGEKVLYKQNGVLNSEFYTEKNVNSYKRYTITDEKGNNLNGWEIEDNVQIKSLEYSKGIDEINEDNYSFFFSRIDNQTKALSFNEYWMAILIENIIATVLSITVIGAGAVIIYGVLAQPASEAINSFKKETYTDYINQKASKYRYEFPKNTSFEEKSELWSEFFFESNKPHFDSKLNNLIKKINNMTGPEMRQFVNEFITGPGQNLSTIDKNIFIETFKQIGKNNEEIKILCEAIKDDVWFDPITGLADDTTAMAQIHGLPVDPNPQTFYDVAPRPEYGKTAALKINENEALIKSEFKKMMKSKIQQNLKNENYIIDNLKISPEKLANDLISYDEEIISSATKIKQNLTKAVMGGNFDNAFIKYWSLNLNLSPKQSLWWKLKARSLWNKIKTSSIKTHALAISATAIIAGLLIASNAQDKKEKKLSFIDKYTQDNYQLNYGKRELSILPPKDFSGDQKIKINVFGTKYDNDGKPVTHKNNIDCADELEIEYIETSPVFTYKTEKKPLNETFSYDIKNKDTWLQLGENKVVGKIYLNEDKKISEDTIVSCKLTDANGEKINEKGWSIKVSGNGTDYRDFSLKIPENTEYPLVWINVYYEGEDGELVLGKTKQRIDILGGFTDPERKLSNTNILFSDSASHIGKESENDFFKDIFEFNSTFGEKYLKDSDVIVFDECGKKLQNWNAVINPETNKISIYPPYYFVGEQKIAVELSLNGEKYFLTNISTVYRDRSISNFEYVSHDYLSDKPEKYFIKNQWNEIATYEACFYQGDKQITIFDDMDNLENKLKINVREKTTEDKNCPTFKSGLIKDFRVVKISETKISIQVFIPDADYNYKLSNGFYYTSLLCELELRYGEEFVKLQEFTDKAPMYFLIK